MDDFSSPIPTAIRMAANHVNVSSGAPVAPDAFLAALRGSQISETACVAVESYLNEADPNELAELVACGATTFASLAALAAKVLPPLHPNRVYLGLFAA